MEDKTTLINQEIEKLGKAIDRLISDNKVLSLELQNRDKEIEKLTSVIKESLADVGDVKEKIANLLLDKK